MGETMNKKYYYKVYGEILESEIELEELFPIEPCENPDIQICLGEIPAYVKEKVHTREQCFAKQGEVAFFVDEVGYYYMQEGKRIYIKENPEYDVYLRKVYALGSAIGILMIQQGRIPIHGGTVARNGKAVIVTGNSGAGKSTISTALRLSGLEFVADDVSVLDFDEQKNLLVQPAYPQQKLCRDAAKFFGYKLEDLTYINESRDKFAVRLKKNFRKESVQLAVMIEICVGDEDQEENLICYELTGHEKLLTFIQNIYRGYIYGLIGMQPMIMKECLRIVQMLPIYRIIRKPKTSTIWDTADLICHLKELG